MAVLLTLLLLALIGLPPTTGFWAKFLLFYNITQFYTVPWNLLLVVFAVITTVIGAYYYFMLAYRVWVLPPAPEHAGKFQPILFARTAILIPTLFTVILGIIYVSVPFDYVHGAYFLTSKATSGI
jgi:NADH-quinone oxidoreductase subunit N